MTETGWVALVGTVGTLLGVFLGAWLKGRFDAREGNRQRQEDRRAEALHTIALTLAAGVGLREEMLRILYESARLDHDPAREFVASSIDAGSRFDADNRAFAAVYMEALMMVRDDDIQYALRNAFEALGTFFDTSDKILAAPPGARSSKVVDDFGDATEDALGRLVTVSQSSMAVTVRRES